ncbi:hypothetical protein SETIT_9G156900v2 [Setaria italica]|uniref:Alcohol dehydrogenase-like N-terminal domain-containing protein n=1 Tax=Setaria italica TaxID=4555 RepID=K4ALJ5_SETIT|nr:hypothetical protein SETIT_9G156900v2 [Setaria italica]
MHEVVGVATGVGPGVTKFVSGDTVGVGYFVDSCRACDSFRGGHGNYCPGVVLASNGVDRDGAATQGGFSDPTPSSTTSATSSGSRGACPPNAPRCCSAPASRCTPHEAMTQYGLNASSGKRLGVVPSSGSGASATWPSSPGKRVEALGCLCADEFLVIARRRTPWTASSTRSRRGTRSRRCWKMSVGAPNEPLELPTHAIIQGGKRVVGNVVGSVGDCQAMLDFAGSTGITADVEVVGMGYVNTAVERLGRNDVRYRFGVDVAGRLGAAA